MTLHEQRTDLWPRLADLPLTVDGYELERLEAEQGHETRVTTHVRLLGMGQAGLGEDVTYYPEEHAALAAGPRLPLAGEWTLEGFADHLATIDQWPAPPRWEAERLYRNWAFESAALDLALRQSRRALHDVLGIEPRPVHYVTSFGLGDPPAIDPVLRRLDHYPGLRFKLDVAPTWTPALFEQVAGTGAVASIDFKGRYDLPVDDADALLTMYSRVLAAFPDAFLEDPHDRPEITELLAPHANRVSYDAPIHSAQDIARLPLPAGMINVKPSRTGGLRALLAIYAHCAAHGLGMYGGGQGEIGVGRGQAQLLAALLHPDTPNDLAPSEFNAPDPPAGLPASPLAPRPDAAGFRMLAQA